MTNKPEPKVNEYIRAKEGIELDHYYALLEVRKKISKLDLKREGKGQYVNQYLTLEQIIAEIEPILLEHSFVTTFFDYSKAENVNILDMGLTLLYVPTGVKIVTSLTLPYDKLTPQGKKASITYARRILYHNLLGLPDQDNDGMEGMSYIDRLGAIKDMTEDFCDDHGNSLEAYHKKAKTDYWAAYNKSKNEKNDVRTKAPKSNPIDEILKND